MTEDKVKQTILVRKDLKMRAGKLAAQVAHASMKFLVDALAEEYDHHYEPRFPFLLSQELEWLFNDKFTKIVLGVNSEEELLHYAKLAKNSGLKVNQIIDSGLTEFHGVPTLTCAAIGPDLASRIDPVTKELKPL